MSGTESLFSCAGCNRKLHVGDRYIEDSPSGFMEANHDSGLPEFDGLIAGILGGSEGKVRYCESCTVPGGDYVFKTVYGDEATDG